MTAGGFQTAALLPAAAPQPFAFLSLLLSFGILKPKRRDDKINTRQPTATTHAVTEER